MRTKIRLHPQQQQFDAASDQYEINRRFHHVLLNTGQEEFVSRFFVGTSPIETQAECMPIPNRIAMTPSAWSGSGIARAGGAKVSGDPNLAATEPCRPTPVETRDKA